MTSSDNIKHPLVSVIIAYYNDLLYIEQAIKSVCEQTYTNWELIIVDDCSPDPKAQNHIKKLQEKYNFKLIHHKENKGSSAAMRTGLNVAKGDYIASIGQDDVMLPHKLDYQIKVMQKKHLDILTCSGITLIEETQKKIPFDEVLASRMAKANKKQMLEYLETVDDIRIFSIQGSLYKKDVLIALKKQCNNLLHDDWPLAILAWKQYKCKFDATQVFLYREHKKSQAQLNIYNNLILEFQTINRVVSENKRSELFAWALINCGGRAIQKKDYKTALKWILAGLCVTDGLNISYAENLLKKIKHNNKKYKQDLIANNVRSIFMLKPQKIIDKIYYKIWKKLNRHFNKNKNSIKHPVIEKIKYKLWKKLSQNLNRKNITAVSAATFSKTKARIKSSLKGN